MPDSAQSSSPGGGRSSARRNFSPAQYHLPYDTNKYLREYRVSVDTDRFVRLPSARVVLTISSGVSVRDG